MVGTFGDMRLPTFEVNHEVLSSESEDELKDTELIGLDVIRGALRTDIVQRFR